MGGRERVSQSRKNGEEVYQINPGKRQNLSGKFTHYSQKLCCLHHRFNLTVGTDI